MWDNKQQRVANGLLDSIQVINISKLESLHIHAIFDSLSGAVIPMLYLPATDNDESSKNSKKNVARSIAMTPWFSFKQLL